MLTGGSSLNLPAVEALINQVHILPLGFMTIGAVPIFSSRD